jgi:threonine/homoserine/homoserine lactone efflux protein
MCPCGIRSLGVGLAAAIYGVVCLPSVGLWALMGTQIRRFLDNPFKRRLFNVAAALALVLLLYPCVMTSRQNTPPRRPFPVTTQQGRWA